MKIPRILVVGSSNTDMVVKTRTLPAPGETVTSGQFLMAPGGKGANQAVAAARLGANVTFVTRVGSDMFGDRAIEGYRNEGIHTDLILRDVENATGVALILVDEQGENLISVASGANHALSPEDIENAAERIGQADAVLLQLEIPLQTVERVARMAAEADVPVILDPAPAPDAPLDSDLLARITYLTPNESEAKRLTGIDVIDQDSARAAAAKLLEAGPKHVIITLGAKGALVAGPDGVDYVPSRTVDPVDSTAAGDAFNGGLAVALARRLPLEEAVRYASHVGALSVTRMGAQPSLPTDADVRDFLEKGAS